MMTETRAKTRELISPCVTKMVEELDTLLQMNLGICLSKDSIRILTCINSALIVSECLPKE